MRRARLLFFAICQFGSASPTLLSAQVEASVDVGASRLRQANVPTGNSFSGGATVDWFAERAQLRATILTSRQTESRWTGQGALFGSLTGDSSSPWWQLDFAASTYAQTSALPTTSAEGAAHARMGSGFRGVALGVGGGASVTGGHTGAVERALGDGWWVLGAERLGASLVWTRTHPPKPFAPSSVSYTDLSGGWRHETGAVAVGLSGGLRFQSSSGPDADDWELVDASVWFAPHAALVFSAGRTLTDFVRGTPRTTWIGASIRLSPSAHSSFARRRSPDQSLPRLTVTRINAERVDLEITAPNATSVELMGDFTDWQPVTLERSAANGAWRSERAIAPGLHRISLRIDGGPWIAPSNLPRADASAEAGVGLLTVP
jgi:hypothetical protein